MATHVDRVVVVNAVEPDVKPGFIDRLLVATETEGIETLLVLNTIDLRSEGPRGAAAAARAVDIVQRYAAQMGPADALVADAGKGATDRRGELGGQERRGALVDGEEDRRRQVAARFHHA